MARFLRRESDNLNKLIGLYGENATKFSEFDPGRPWNHLFKYASQQTDYWKNNVELPCLRIISGHITVQSILDGDAEIESSYGINRSVPPSPHPAAPRPKKTKNQSASASSIPQFPNEYCRKWSVGTCVGATCPLGRIHACEICGGPHFTKNHGKDQNSKKKGGKGGKRRQRRKRQTG